MKDWEIAYGTTKVPGTPSTTKKQLSDAERVYGVDPVRELMTEFGVNREIAEELHRIETTGGPTTQRSETEIEADRIEANRQLQQTYKLDTDKVVQRMAELINQRPKLKEALNASGSGNSPKLVTALARTAAEQLRRKE